MIEAAAAGGLVGRGRLRVRHSGQRQQLRAVAGARPGNVFGTGKNVPLIAMAHHIPYVATASVASCSPGKANTGASTGCHPSSVRIHAAAS